MSRAASEVRVGDALPTEHISLDQGDLVRYAGASGDFNPLHWDADVAARVSPTGGVIAHGMLSLGHVSRMVTDWAGGPERVRELDAVFRAPAPVGSTLALGGEVLAVDAETGLATLRVWAVLPDGAGVIDPRRSRAVVVLS